MCISIDIADAAIIKSLKRLWKNDPLGLTLYLFTSILYSLFLAWYTPITDGEAFFYKLLFAFILGICLIFPDIFFRKLGVDKFLRGLFFLSWSALLFLFFGQSSVNQKISGLTHAPSSNAIIASFSPSGRQPTNTSTDNRVRFETTTKTTLPFFSSTPSITQEHLLTATIAPTGAITITPTVSPSFAPSLIDEDFYNQLSWVYSLWKNESYTHIYTGGENIDKYYDFIDVPLPDQSIQENIYNPYWIVDVKPNYSNGMYGLVFRLETEPEGVYIVTFMNNEKFTISYIENKKSETIALGYGRYEVSEKDVLNNDISEPYTLGFFVENELIHPVFNGDELNVTYYYQNHCGDYISTYSDTCGRPVKRFILKVQVEKQKTVSIGLSNLIITHTIKDE